MEFKPEQLKEKIDPKAAFAFLNGLANKVPDEIANLIKKILLIILIILALGAGVYGWQEGTAKAIPLGMSIGTDARSLFMETMEREYNRKRRDIQVPELYSEERGSSPSMEYESFLKDNGNSPKVYLERQDLMEDGIGLRNARKKDPYPMILQTEYSDRYMPEPEFAPSLPPVSSPVESYELQRKPSEEEKSLPESTREIPKPESKPTNAPSRLEKLVDRLERIEKKLSSEPKPVEEKRSLEIPNR